MHDCLVFVYGTLKSTMSARMQSIPNARLLGEEIIGPGFIMVDLGLFPAVVLDTVSVGCVHGEVWSMPLQYLSWLDAYEDYPSLYLRSLINTSHGAAWVYHMSKVNGLMHANKTTCSHNNVFSWQGSQL